MRTLALEGKRTLVSAAALLIAWTIAPFTARAQDRPAVTIGILTDGPLGRFGELVNLVERETRILLESRYNVRMDSTTRIDGDNTLAGISAALDELLSRTDVIVAVGTMAAQVAAQDSALTKPIVAPFVLDRSLQDVPRAGAASGVPNFFYLTRPENRDLETLAEVVEFERLAVLVNAPTFEQLPSLAERIETRLAESGVTAAVIPVDEDIPAALEAIEAADVDAVYVLPLVLVNAAQLAELADGLIQLKLPSMSWFGESEVREGILLGRRPDSFMFQIARLTALNIQQILRGEEAGQLRVMFVPQERVIVNMRTARAIGAYPSWAMLSDAELIEPGAAPEGEPQSLDSVVREALERNQDLAAFDRAVQAAAQDVKLATSQLLPQLDLEVSGSVIDQDRAAASLGVLPERLLVGSVGLSQILYSDRAWAERAIQKSLQRAREEDYASLRLDVSFEAADAYLTLLRRTTDERIRRENLAFTRTNMDLSEVRRQTGAATPGEVLRWRAQVAKDRQGVISAAATREIAQTRLNRLLHRSIAQPVATPESDLDEPVIRWAEDALMRLLDDPQSFDGFQEFMVAEALTTAPELRAVDALIAGQDRALTAARRAFWLPGFYLGAQLSNWLATGGAGSDLSSGVIPPDLIGPEQDPWRWSIQIGARYQIFGGGSRTAAKNQAEQSLFSLQYQRASTAEQVEQSTREALQLLKSSRVRLELAREAADAARGNFELVQTAYGGGVTGVLNLLDAQSTALIADLDAANALYDFITNFMLVQRTAGRIDLLLDETQREAFVQRLETYLRERGIP
jgi:outer membrane protein